MRTLQCMGCDCEIDVDVEDIYFDLRDDMGEIADLLAAGHAEAAYNKLARHYDLGPIEARRRLVAGYGAPAHLLERR